MMSSLRPSSDKPRYFAFRNRSRTPPLSSERADRQGQVANLAFLYLGGRDGAMTFLNNYDADLDGRPLDIASASANGCIRVSMAIMRLATSSRPPS